MRLLKIFFTFFLAAGGFAAPLFAQTSHWYFGSGIGAQQWRGPLNANPGISGEILFGRAFSQHGALVLTAGYASLPFQQSSFQSGIKFTLVSREANLFYGDVRFELHPLGWRAISPYLGVGGGLVNVQVGAAARKNYPAGTIGGGLLARLNKDLLFHLSGNYHHLAGQTLAGFDAGKSPEGFIGARAGLLFSPLPNKNEPKENWFTTLDSELSPFAEQNESQVATTATPAETLTTATEAPVEPASEAVLDSVMDETPALVREEEPSETDTAQASPDAAEASSAETKFTNEDNVSEGDPFSRFNRKLELLEQETTAPEPSKAATSLLEDEPDFESFYPPAQADDANGLEQELLEEENLTEASDDISSIDERIAKLDEQEDFLSPETQVETAAPNLGEFDSRLRTLDERFENVPETEEPAPAVPQQHNHATETKSPAPPLRTNVSDSNMIDEGGTTEPVKHPPFSEGKVFPPDASLSQSAASAKTAPLYRPQPVEDQELLEMRTLLDQFEGDTSHAQGDYDATRALAMRSDGELEELRHRLDELTAGERHAQLSAQPNAGLNEGNASQAYEAFKDRLGLMEEQPKSFEAEEWDQQSLKSQISSIDKELEQKEEDLTAIRTALAQSAANGTAFPASPVVSRGSFAHGYEGALNSFYMQRYAEAVGKFSRLIEQYPAHTLTSNCYYWLGEAQYGHGDYQAAIVSFNRVLAFERSLKKDNALLMLGKTYMALQRPTDARAAFNRLNSEYPFSDAVAKAQKMMKSM